MIREIIFDCFGVLTEDGWLVFLSKYDHPDYSEELRYLNFQYDNGHLPYDEFLTGVCRITGVERSEADAMITTALHPNIRLLDYIRQLRASEYKLGVISNVGMPLDSILPPAFLDCFDHMTLSYQVHAIKPHPDIFWSHLESTGSSPEETVFIDDREVNCEGARAIGMHALQYRDVPQLREDLTALLT